MIGGDLAYGRADWLPGLSADADQDRLEPLIAWGKPMLLDTSYAVPRPRRSSHGCPSFGRR